MVSQPFDALIVVNCATCLVIVLTLGLIIIIQSIKACLDQVFG